MLPKSKKPTAAQLRPKALTDSSYTIFIALIKNRVEKHFNYATINYVIICKLGLLKREEFKIIYLQVLYECKKMSFRKKKPSIVISIDNTKAYNSINKKEIVEIRDIKI